MVADSRTPALNTQVSHSIFTQKYRAKGHPWERLLDLPTFGHSNNHVPLQIADMLSPTLLFPMATASYCAGQITGKHIKKRDKFIKRRYASGSRRCNIGSRMRQASSRVASSSATACRGASPI